MENKKHRLMVVSYELYCIENGKEYIIEKSDDMQPMQLYTGCDMALPAFEQEVVKFDKDTDFKFSLTKEQAYGERDDKSVLALNKATFSPNGVFDTENIYKDAVVPLQNEEGQRFLGKVLDISDDKVTIDLNHPLAGKDLIFHGHVFENREASEEEVKDFFEQMKQHHCSGGCGGGCGSDCGNSCGCKDHEEGEGGCCGCH
ncbi:FKBP-type peptidyl-prolyl cis-trans isomerase [Prevotella melaninogenica]|uniref:FKBP-type peptidyl-prolyl cis-trans isomerase n=1 Tax=Prevotella melaninogenica TaxID=28132 RepID=UPI001BAAEE43|nr:FKBP-type peptidyl-prolyl cis-trans isomerase [Prevotella melaninogenica]QUB62329.1 FKBP-type peptidyl-prolyl cis-trans isomerase [Prevotella melaninogenica]